METRGCCLIHGPICVTKSGAKHEGLTFTELQRQSGNHLSAAERKAAVERLTERGAIQTLTESTGGRRRTRLVASQFASDPATEARGTTSATHAGHAARMAA